MYEAHEEYWDIRVHRDTSWLQLVAHDDNIPFNIPHILLTGHVRSGYNMGQKNTLNHYEA